MQETGEYCPCEALGEQAMAILGAEGLSGRFAKGKAQQRPGIGDHTVLLNRAQSRRLFRGKALLMKNMWIDP